MNSGCYISYQTYYMLPFFRKIRWRLAQDNQLFKYSRYAIGEIVLVVVGILIALYINNWNEKRKEREKFDQILVEVEKELVYNINMVRDNIRYYNEKDSICSHILLDSLELDDYKGTNRVTLLKAINIFKSLLIIDESFKNLREINNLDSKQDSIIKMLNFLNSRAKSVIDLQMNQLTEIFKENEKMYYKYDWFKDWYMDRLKDDDIIDYFIENSEFLNAVTRYWGVVHRLTEWETRYETEGIKAYKIIHKYLQDKNPDHIDSLIVDYDPENFKHYIGKYDVKWYSSLDWLPSDSVVVSIEKDKLIYTGYRPNGQTPIRAEIIPENKFLFRTEYGGYYRILFNKNAEVDGIFISRGPKFTMKLKKIH